MHPEKNKYLIQSRMQSDVAPTITENSDLPHPPLRSPIFWRIATVVFISIVVIEAVLLVFSWFSERDRLLTRIDDSLALLTPVLVGSEQANELEKLLYHGELGGQHPLRGYVMQWSNGVKLQNGDTQGLIERVAGKEQSFFDSKTGTYDSYRIVPSVDSSLEAGLWLRIDASQVNEELRSYVFRIIALVILISLFVTAGCLLFLTPLLIRPLQKLNQLMLIGQSRGLRHVSTPEEAINRNDELGNVYRSFEQLRCDLIASEDENNHITNRFQHFADLGADSFWEVDKHLSLTYAAGDLSGMFAIDTSQVLGQSVRQLRAQMKHAIPDINSVLSSLKTNGFWEGSLKLPGDNNGDRVVRIVASALLDDKGRFAGARGTVVDVTVASKLARELKHHASHDALTGLSNRREFDEMLDQALNDYRQKGKSLCVCMLDLDRFKIVNDNCGHAAGDLLLKQLAELIQKSVRDNDTVARFGGDEFTVILLGCNLENGIKIAEKIRQMIDAYRFYWKEEVYNVGVSIGIAEASPSLDCNESVLLAADACCIKAKRLGRNQVQFFSPTDETVVKHHDEMQWMASITQALEEDRLALYQQPIAPVGKPQNNVIHFEVLLRMLGRDGEVYSPNEFLPAAERYSLIGKIDRWVVNHVIAWLSRQPIDAQTQLCVSINLSAMTVSDNSFQTFLYSCINECNVFPGHLCFEITESAAMKDTSDTIEFLNSMRTLGCRIALDDFGTGFSSLSHIQKLPLDYIKIDGAFIKDIVDNPLDQALVRSVVEVAGILGVKTIAEFVETDEAFTILEQLKIDYAQGYLLSKPKVLGDLIERGDQLMVA